MASNYKKGKKNFQMSSLQVIFYDGIEEFYTAVSGVSEDTSLNTPFQYEDWQKKLFAEHIALKSKVPYLGAILYQGNIPILGGHFFVKRSGKRRGIFLLGSGGETDYYDLVYFSTQASEDYIDFFLNQVAEKSKCQDFTFMQIPNESLLSKWAKRLSIEPYYVNECAWVNLQGTFEEYLASLSKSVRQNIRTANNRLTKDKHIATLDIYDETDLPSDKITEIINLYESRRKAKNEIRSVKIWLREQLRKHNKKKYNIIAEAMKDMKGKFLAVYNIDSEIAAYCFGLKNKNGLSICIMQVAINDDYNKYSPGILLLVEVFKKIMEQKDGQNFLFDLTNGNEKYKYSLGAVSHYTNYYKFCLNK